MGNTTERGLGWEHQKRRAELLEQWIGRPCPTCGTPLQRGRMDFDHEIPRALGGKTATRFLCRRCNRSRGAALGNRLRWRQQPATNQPRSRNW